MKHSGLGIASLIISVFAGLASFGGLIALGMMEMSAPHSLDENSPELAIFGFAFLGMMFVTVAALGLGIGGLCQSQRHKLFPILGTVFSGTLLLLMLAIIAIGLIAG